VIEIAAADAREAFQTLSLQGFDLHFEELLLLDVPLELQDCRQATLHQTNGRA
jgi:hypothetical protein